MHYCNNDYICIPFSAGGNLTCILKINISSEKEKKYIKKILPYIKTYLKEASSVLEAKFTLELLHNQAIKDPLTNLYNRRYLDNVLPMIIATAKRRNEKIGFLMIDTDYFKKVNDTYGHKAGDTVLKILAKILKNSVRESDIVIRYGGEEFLILLQNIQNLNDAKIVAEKIRKTVENTEIKLEDKTIKKTVSIGISIFPEHCEKGWECVKYADFALYKAKRNGRNRVEIFNESTLSNNKYDKNG
jgi:diguanylate cyclase (GGDEF)-like protein